MTTTTCPSWAQADERAAWSMTDAARFLSIGRSTLYRLEEAGELRTVTILGRRLVPTTEIRRLVGESS